MHHRFVFRIIPIILTILSSCSARNANVTKSYLNYKYALFEVGDLHGLPPYSKEKLNYNPGFKDYLNLFDRSKSYLNYQCKGTAYENFYCEASFYLYDKKGNEIIKKDSFICQYTGGQSGMIIYNDEEIKNELGAIYVYTPYWCRWQFEYDVDNSGTKTLLTFEFWISEFNPMPSFLETEK